MIPGSTSILIAYYRLFSIAEMHRPTYPPPSETKTLAPDNACFILIIIINLFIEGSLFRAKALFCPRALFGATRIYEDALLD